MWGVSTQFMIGNITACFEGVGLDGGVWFGTTLPLIVLKLGGCYHGSSEWGEG